MKFMFSIQSFVFFVALAIAGPTSSS